MDKEKVPGPPGGQFENFGAVLRHYRETVSQRLGRPDLPTMQVTAVALLKCIQQTDTGAAISQAAYSDIENGFSLPRNPERFLHAVASCLAITVGSLEWQMLVQYLGYGLMAQKLGPALADQLLETDIREIQTRLDSDNQRDKPARKRQ
jgi:hypothetical protein